MKIIKRLLLIFLVFLLIGGTILGVSGYMEYKKVIKEKSIESMVAEIRSQENFVEYEEISPLLLKATIAIEDKRFYEHGGIDYIGLMRALLGNVVAQKVVGGGSTITQQLAKNMYFGYEASLTRKVGEVFVSRDLENKYSKNEILELYVNIINYGDNHIGIMEASQGYFQRVPIDLDLSQASILAGIPQSPSNFQLSNHLKEAKIRQKAVLKAMVEQNVVMYVESVQAQE